MNLRKLTIFSVLLINNSDVLLTSLVVYEILQQQLFVKYSLAIIGWPHIYRNIFKYTHTSICIYVIQESLKWGLDKLVCSDMTFLIWLSSISLKRKSTEIEVYFRSEAHWLMSSRCFLPTRHIQHSGYEACCELKGWKFCCNQIGYLIEYMTLNKFSELLICFMLYIHFKKAEISLGEGNLFMSFPSQISLQNNI